MEAAGSCWSPRGITKVARRPLGNASPAPTQGDEVVQLRILVEQLKRQIDDVEKAMSLRFDVLERDVGLPLTTFFLPKRDPQGAPVLSPKDGAANEFVVEPARIFYRNTKLWHDESSLYGVDAGTAIIGQDEGDWVKFELSPDEVRDGSSRPIPALKQQLESLAEKHAEQQVDLTAFKRALSIGIGGSVADGFQQLQLVEGPNSILDRLQRLEDKVSMVTQECEAKVRESEAKVTGCKTSVAQHVKDFKQSFEQTRELLVDVKSNDFEGFAKRLRRLETREVQEPPASSVESLLSARRPSIGTAPGSVEDLNQATEKSANIISARLGSACRLLLGKDVPVEALGAAKEAELPERVQREVHRQVEFQVSSKMDRARKDLAEAMCSRPMGEDGSETERTALLEDDDESQQDVGASWMISCKDDDMQDCKDSTEDAMAISTDMWGATISTIAKDLPHILFGTGGCWHWLRLSGVFTCQAMNVVLQILLIYLTSKHVVEPNIVTLQQDYGAFHGRTFDATGAVNKTAWQQSSGKKELCYSALANNTFTFVVILLWTIRMMGEFWDCTAVALHIMRTPSSDPNAVRTRQYANMVKSNVNGSTIVKFPWRIRLCCYVFVVLPKVSVCAFVYWNGLALLVASRDLESLLFGALALEFIIKVDELIFEFVVPKTFQYTVKRLKFKSAMRKNREVSNKLIRDWVTAFFITGACIVMAWWYLELGQQVLPYYNHDIEPLCVKMANQRRPCERYALNCFPYGSGA